jgi:hypothetical protein
MFTEYEMGGTVTDKGLTLDAPEAFKGAMRSFKRGRIRVKVELEKETRSARANRYYFGVVLKAISEHTGYEVDELHDYFKLQFNARELMVGRESAIVGSSTRRLDSQKFYDYLERIRRFASMELGITLPEPERREVA